MPQMPAPLRVLSLALQRLALRELQERLFPGAQRALLEGLVATWWLKRKSSIEIDASRRGLALPLSTMESDTIESIIYICREVYGAKTDASTETMLKQGSVQDPALEEERRPQSPGLGRPCRPTLEGPSPHHRDFRHRSGYSYA